MTRIAIYLVLALATAAGLHQAARPGARPGRADLSEATRGAGFRFDPSATPYDRQAFEAALASARPEARRLVEQVDGLVTVRFGATGGDALGVTSGREDGFDVVLDLATVQQRYGPRGIARVVLHELGHVIDFSILSEDVRARLDAGIPRGYACEPGEPTGSCASAEERFAESFAKWAMNDIGVDLYIGYKVPPPAMPLEDWGRPLAQL